MDYSYKILTELQDILKYVKGMDLVTIEEFSDTIREDALVHADIGLDTIVFDEASGDQQVDGYLKHFFLTLQVNVNCKKDKFYVYEMTDKIEWAISSDTKLWTSIIDRNIKSVVYDNGNNAPYRAFTMVLEVTARTQHMNVVCE